ncbi:MAG: hypothetical protein J6D21_10615 [Clostridia bacterium]|nr:hypothetical protein [Clostridia bacterium]
MTRRKKLLLYGALLLVGLAIFILEIFVFQKPDGTLGLILCLISVAMILGGLIRLCQLSDTFENVFWAILDLLT